MRIEIDWDSCIGNGMCCALAPTYFDLDAEGTLVQLRDDVEPADEDTVGEAMASCPVGAIQLQK